MLRQRRRVLRRQPQDLRRQQLLHHHRLLMGPQPVEVDPLVGGVLVDEPHIRPVLGHDVGPQHLPGKAPRGWFLRQQGILPRLLFVGRRQGQSRRLLRRRGLHRLHRCRHGRHSGSRRLRRGKRDTLPHRQGAHLRRRPRRSGPAEHVADRQSSPQLRGDRRHTCHKGALPVRVRLPEGPDVHLLIEVPPGYRRGAYLRRGLPLRRSRWSLPGVQRVPHHVTDRGEHLPVIDELHHRLGWVHVHIHPVLGQGDVEHTAGEAPLHDLVLIGLLQRGGEELGLHKPPVDKEHLHGPVSPAAEGPGDEALHPDTIPAAPDR